MFASLLQLKNGRKHATDMQCKQFCFQLTIECGLELNRQNMNNKKHRVNRRQTQA